MARLRSLAAHDARVMRQSVPPENREGAGKAGCLASTHGPPAKKMQAAGTTGTAEQPAFPARRLYGLYVISPGTGFLAPVATMRGAHRVATTLTRCAGISTGMPGPHDFTVRETPAFVQRGAHGHRSPPPRIVTTRTPSAWRRVRRRKAQFLKNGSGIFFARRLYIARRVESADEIRRSARGFSAAMSTRCSLLKLLTAHLICPTGRADQQCRPREREDP